jgi:hypothetical protein
MEHVLAGCCRSFRGMGRGAGIIAIDIDRVKGLHYLAPGDPMGDDVGRMHGIWIRGRWMGPIDGAQLSGGVGRQLVTPQHPLNRAQTGEEPVAVGTLVLDGAGANGSKPQAWSRVPDQLLAQADDAPFTTRRQCVGMMMGGTGSRGKARPGGVRDTGPTCTPSSGCDEISGPRPWQRFPSDTSLPPRRTCASACS